MNTIIIGCGYVGGAVAQHWQSLGRVMTATTTTPERIAELEQIVQRAVVLEGVDEQTLESVLQDQQTVYLSVAPTASQQVDADGYEKTYLQTAKSLVSALRKAPNVKQLIYTSSSAIYGDSQGGWVDEASAVLSSNRHAEILLETEQVLLSASSPALSVCILRLGAIYGPEREIGTRFAKLAGTTRSGTGDYFTNWVHLDDIVSVSEFALDRHLQGIYNVVSDGPVTVRELFERVCHRFELPPVEWDASDLEDQPSDRRISNQKLKQAGYQFLHPTVEV